MEGNKNYKKHHIIVIHDLGTGNTMPIKKDSPHSIFKLCLKKWEGRKTLFKKKVKKSESPTHLGNNLETILCKHEIACFRKWFKLIYAWFCCFFYKIFKLKFGVVQMSLIWSWGQGKQRKFVKCLQRKFNAPETFQKIPPPRIKFRSAGSHPGLSYKNVTMSHSSLTHGIHSTNQTKRKYKEENATKDKKI